MYYLRTLKIISFLSALSLFHPLDVRAESNFLNKEEPDSLFQIEPTSGIYSTEASIPANYPKASRSSFLDFINARAYAATIDKETEREILRQQWKDMLDGVDVFYPYFKAKEVEDWASEKMGINFFKLKGRPKFDNNQIIYIFKIKL